MTHPLDGADIRVARADEHFKTVEGKWLALSKEAKSVTFQSKYEADAQKIIVSIATAPVIDQTGSLDISECLFNLRCALDYLTWELACWNLRKKGEAREPSPQTQYPISTAEEKFNKGQIHDLDSGHVAVIKWLQPYSPLFMAKFQGAVLRGANQEGLAHHHVAVSFNRLNNTGKHRFIQVSAVKGRVTELGTFEAHDCEVVNPNFFIQGGAFEEDAKWAKFEVASVTGPNPRVEVPAEIDPTLSYAGASFLFDYPSMRSYVTQVLDIFREVLATS